MLRLLPKYADAENGLFHRTLSADADANAPACIGRYPSTLDGGSNVASVTSLGKGERREMGFIRFGATALAALAIAGASAGPADSAISYASIFTISSVSPKATPLSAFVRSRSCQAASETIADGHKKFIQSIVDRIEKVSPNQAFPNSFPSQHDARSEFVTFYHKTHHGFVLEIQTLTDGDAIAETVSAMAACTSLGTGSRVQIEKVGLYVNPKTHAGLFFSSDAGFYIVQPDPGDHD